MESFICTLFIPQNYNCLKINQTYFLYRKVNPALDRVVRSDICRVIGATYSELNLNTQRKKTVWIAGLNFLTDDFNEVQHNSAQLRDYHYNTFGIFLQNTWAPVSKFSLETGTPGATLG